MRKLRYFLSLVALIALMLPAIGSLPVRADQGDPRYFSQTGFRISDDRIWNYFNQRGGIPIFGYPVSRTFTLLGFEVQFFQRQILQIFPDGHVATMNILDKELMPYTSINGSVFPAASDAVTNAAPKPSDPNYATGIIAFVQKYAPNTWNGNAVNFYQTFANTVSMKQAFPNGGGNAGLLQMINLEMWGAPTSQPAADPTNPQFIYLRFQRGVMHYDAANRTTQGLLLADYLKSIITGKNLPLDLSQEAANSRFFKQYAPDQPNWVARPNDLPYTNLTNAFEPQSAGGNSPDYGVNLNNWWFPQADAQMFGLVKGLQLNWTKLHVPWNAIETQPGNYDWGRLDIFMKQAQEHGVKVLLRIDSQPFFYRADGIRTMGPPDDYNKYGTFLAALANRYKTGSQYGTVNAIEIWNEPNLAGEWGNKQPNAAQYVNLVKVGYNAVKAVDPNIVIVSAGLSPTGTWNAEATPDAVFFEQMYQAGIANYVDAIGVHAPGYKAAPEVSPAQAAADPALGGQRFFTFRHVEDLRDIMNKYNDGAHPVWILEFGWTSDTVHPDYSWFAVTEQQKADYLVRAFAYAKQNWRPWIGPMFVWCLPSPDWTNNNEALWWSITNADGTPRPAYTALQNMPK